MVILEGVAGDGKSLSNEDTEKDVKATNLLSLESILYLIYIS